jgi:hypothetical protein
MHVFTTVKGQNIVELQTFSPFLNVLNVNDNCHQSWAKEVWGAHTSLGVAVGDSLYMSVGEVVDTYLCDSSSSKLFLMGKKLSMLAIETYSLFLDFLGLPSWISFL